MTTGARTVDPATILKVYGVDGTEHTDRTFYDHLMGTGDMLRRWGCDEHVCLAGYFHAFYGTEGTTEYKSPMALSARGELRARIGDAAEELVYLYCVSRDRHEYGLDVVRPAGWSIKNRLAPPARIAVPRATLIDLAVIDAANLVEQFARMSRVTRAWFRVARRQGYIAALPYLPAPGRDAVRATLAWL
ncbi:DUF6817 domain-containing protein [Sorangium sp. So ce1182]|uniref:DUF6817 domain-containing protein n=1 Tax=Sorangium sp. So ce1182 TaxID=3133334 RepID=UPI003F632590